MINPIRIHSDWWEFGLGDFAFGVDFKTFVYDVFPHQIASDVLRTRTFAVRHLEQYVRDQIDDVVYIHWLENTLIVGTLDESYFAVAKLENSRLYRCSKGVYVRVNT